MILFHGTTGVFLPKTLRWGLQPRQETGNSNYVRDLISDPGRVYLTDVHAIAFALQATRQHGGNILIAAARVDKQYLEPDTDFMEEGPGHGQRFDKSQAIACLNQTGCVSVVGGVNPHTLYRLTAKQTRILDDDGFIQGIPSGVMHKASHELRGDVLNGLLLLANSLTLNVDDEWVDDLGRVVAKLKQGKPHRLLQKSRKAGAK